MNIFETLKTYRSFKARLDDDDDDNQILIEQLEIEEPDLVDLVELYHQNQSRLQRALFGDIEGLEKIGREAGLEEDDSYSNAAKYIAYDTDLTDRVMGILMTPIRLQLEREDLVQILSETRELFNIFNMIEVRDGEVVLR